MNYSKNGDALLESKKQISVKKKRQQHAEAIKLTSNTCKYSNTQSSISVDNHDCLSRRFELLHVLNFDSVRRRMSVIVRSSAGVMGERATRTVTSTQCHWISLTGGFVFAQETTCCSVRGPTRPSSLGWCLGRWSR